MRPGPAIYEVPNSEWLDQGYDNPSGSRIVDDHGQVPHIGSIGEEEGSSGAWTLVPVPGTGGRVRTGLSEQAPSDPDRLGEDGR